MPKINPVDVQNEIEDSEWEYLKISIELNLEKCFQTIDRMSMSKQQRAAQIAACCETICDDIAMSTFS